jgi:hypothetical protein
MCAVSSAKITFSQSSLIVRNRCYQYVCATECIKRLFRSSAISKCALLNAFSAVLLSIIVPY